MKKVLLSVLSILILAVSANAQYNVSTQVENKNVLIEEFTGIKCGYCPQAHKIVSDLIRVQPENVFAIAIHAGSYATPGGDQPDFRLTEGEAINDYFGVTGYPAGFVNRNRYEEDRIIISRNTWGEKARLETETPAIVNLWSKATYDDQSRKLTIDVEGYYTANSAVSTNRLNVVLTQNNIMGPQSGGGKGDEYMHQHVSRAFLTGTWGEEIKSCKQGDFFSKQYVYNVPADIKDVEVNPAELEVVVFLTEDEETVLNVTGCVPEYEGAVLPLAADLADPMIPIGDRYGFNYFEVDLKNKSTEAITSATFSIRFNSVDYEVEWTGNAAPRSTTSLTLPFDVISNMKATGNNYYIQLTSLNGQEYKSNRLSGRFSAPLVVSPALRFKIGTDIYADENRFLIKDIEGNIVHEFGPYERGECVFVDEMLFLDPNKQYVFEITDSWANGMIYGSSFYEALDASGKVVFSSNIIESNGCREFFTTSAANASTELQNKQVLIEEFTGIYCGNCPDAHEMIAELLKSQGDKVNAIAIHSGPYADCDDPNYRTEYGEIYDEHFVPDGYPSGMVNRRHLVDGEIMLSRAYWVKCAKQISQEIAPVNLWIGTQYDVETSTLTVNVEGYYTQDVENDFNMLNIAITQSGIVGPQNGGGSGGSYVHNHMARAYLTPVWGDTIASCKKGDSFRKIYTYVVPKSINGVATDVFDFEILAYVCRDKEDVLNVLSSHVNLPADYRPLKARIEHPLIPVGGTYAYNYYEALLVNESNQDIYEAGFDIYVNEGHAMTEWTGVAPARSTTLIKIPVNQSAVITDANDYTVKLGGLNYQLYDGNSISGDFQDPVSTTPRNKFIIKTDTCADENTFVLKDMSGKVIYDFGPYAPGVVTQDTVVLDLPSNQTYCLEITDAWGDGVMTPRGTCKIYNESGKLVAQQLEIKAHGARVFIATDAPGAVQGVNVDESFAIHYSKADEAVVVATAIQEPYEVALYNIGGQCFYRATATDMHNIPVNQAGVYMVVVVANGQQFTQKVVAY